MTIDSDRYIIGLTGGISSGKSTAADEFNRMGAQVIKADDLGREVTEWGRPAYKEIVELWPQYQLDDGSLDRPAMRGLLRDPTTKSQLEEIVRPRVRERLMIVLSHRIGEYAVYESAQLQRDPLFDRILFVSINADTQAQRYRDRGDMGEHDLRAVQTDEAEFLRMADDVVPNNSTEGHLRAAIRSLNRNIYLPAAREKKVVNKNQPI